MGEEGGHVDEVACSSTAEYRARSLSAASSSLERIGPAFVCSRGKRRASHARSIGRIRFGGDDESCETVGYLNPLHVESFLDEQCLQLR